MFWRNTLLPTLKQKVLEKSIATNFRNDVGIMVLRNSIIWPYCQKTGIAGSNPFRDIYSRTNCMCCVCLCMCRYVGRFPIHGVLPDAYEFIFSELLLNWRKLRASKPPSLTKKIELTNLILPRNILKSMDFRIRRALFLCKVWQQNEFHHSFSISLTGRRWIFSCQKTKDCLMCCRGGEPLLLLYGFWLEMGSRFVYVQTRVGGRGCQV